jgi:microcystin degradation protein MlrC
MKQLLRCIREGARPRMALVTVPLLIPGEYAMTTAEPAARLYAEIEALTQQPGVLDASLMVGYAWADRPHSTASVIVVAEHDHALAERLARAFAQRVWACRQEFAYPGESAAVDECVRRAMASTVRPVVVSDSGDNVTAGAAGDMTVLLEALLTHGATQALVAGIEDGAAVTACARAGIGTAATLALGNRIGLRNSAPLTVTATVSHIGNECATVRIAGVHVLITAQRTAFFSVAQIAALSGLDPMQLHIVVVKLGYLMPDLYDHAPRAILALSPGLTDLDMRRFGHTQVVRPIYPLDLA